MIDKSLGHYEILGRIGSGGMGEVYRARDTKLLREVALKVLPPDMARDRDRLSRFQREARAVAALQHPNIVTIHSVEEADGIRFLTMELVEGQTLAEHLADHRPHPEEICELLLPLVDALSAAHEKGIVHRDLKPANVMLTPNGQVKLLDFGLAKLETDAHRDEADTEALTQAGKIVGTLSYMSPEQLRGKEVDARSDLFSLGILVYELATGRHPFPGENAAETISSILRDTPLPCSELTGSRAEGLASILVRCLDKNPDRRYQTAGELREDLARLKQAMASSEATDAPPPSPDQEDLRTRGREAIARQEWALALELLEQADRTEPLPPDDLELLGEALFWMGDVDGCTRARERAYAAYVEEGRDDRAGHTAVLIAERYFNKRAKAVTTGWLQRAERHLGEEESIANGHLNRLRTRMSSGDPERALQLSERTLSLGRKFGDADLESLGLMDRGCALVRLGRVPEGMALIDEAMVSATGGRLSPIVTGRIYCNMMSVCEELADFQRAAEWSEVATSWCEPHQHSSYPGICRVHRATVLRVRGDWGQAEDLARLAGKEMAGHSVSVAASAVYEIGEIELRRGALDSAEAAFNRAHEQGLDPLPGLALLRFAQGRAKAARNLIQRGLDETSYALDRARLLPARIEIALGTADLTAARAAIEELEKTSESFGSTVHRNAARHGRGMLLLAEGNVKEAVRELRVAWKTWSELDLPYEGARARLALGEAYRAAGNLEDAELELRAAQSTFERLGAAPLSRQAVELLAAIHP
jgi:serine/threonine protein kinase